MNTLESHLIQKDELFRVVFSEIRTKVQSRVASANGILAFFLSLVSSDALNFYKKRQILDLNIFLDRYLKKKESKV